MSYLSDVFNGNEIIAAADAFSNVTSKTYLGRPWSGTFFGNQALPCTYRAFSQTMLGITCPIYLFNSSSDQVVNQGRVS